MKQKHKDAMIAMGIKIAALETLNRKNLVTGNDNKQEIRNILRTLKLHGEGHMANDLTPQFRQLCEKVEGLEKTHNGICTQKSTEDWLNKLSEEQDKLQERIKGLENRLSRAQDMIAECHPSGCLCGEKKEVMKTCSNCGGWNDSPLNTRCDQCVKQSLWKPKAKPSGRPKKPVKAGKVQ